VNDFAGYRSASIAAILRSRASTRIFKVLNFRLQRNAIQAFLYSVQPSFDSIQSLLDSL